MSRTLGRIALGVAIALLAAACLGPAATDPPAPAPTEPPATEPPPPTDAPPPTEPPPTEPPPTEPPPTEEPTPEPTEAPAPELPETPVVGVLGSDPQMGSKFDIATGESLEYDESELPVPLGVVAAHWFTWNDKYVVAYSGLDLAETGPLCPGNSIRTATGFEFVTNAPTEAGACDGVATLTDDPNVGPRVCHGIVLYVTAIPSDRQGYLFGTLNKLVDGGAAVSGLTSVAQTSPDIAAIDLDQFCG